MKTLKLAILALGLVACAKTMPPPLPAEPVYSQESFNAIDELLVEFQARFFDEIQTAENEEVFRGVHPEITKAKAKTLRIYETRPTASANPNWKELIQIQIESSNEVLEMLNTLLTDESIDSTLRHRLEGLSKQMKNQRREIFHRFALLGED